MNIVSMILQFLAPSLVGRMASSLGIESSVAQRAIAAAVPAILAGLAGKAATPEGARQLSNTIGQQDPGILGKFGSLLGGAQQGSLVSAGTSILGGLLGGSQLGSLAGALGKFTGAGDAASKGLLGMLAPVVLGQLGQVQKSSGLDAGGLASLLAGQKDNIAGAMPAGFAQLLGGSGLLDSVAGNVKAAPVAAPAGRVEAAAPKSGQPRWALPVLVAIALLLAWNVFFRKGPEVVTPKPPAVTAAAPALGAVEIGNQTKSLVESLGKTFSGIKDKAAADAALPSIRDASTKLEGLREQFTKLDGAQRKTVADVIATFVPGLKTLIDAALAVPGVGDVLRQPAGDILARLGAMTKA